MGFDRSFAKVQSNARWIELRGFVEASTADKLRRGMAPDQATRAARVEMGSANAVKRQHSLRSMEAKVEISGAISATESVCSCAAQASPPSRC